MSYSIENKYIGDLRTVSTHLNSGDKITTDAPLDNNGKGEAFSPTDLVCTALCSCMTTIMGICAEKGNFILPKSTAKIIKVMSEKPRKISEIHIELNFEDNNLSEAQKNKLKEVASRCPVAMSLDKELTQKVKFNF